MTSPASGQVSKSDYQFLCSFLREQMGYELGEGKEYLVDGRLAPVAATFGLNDVSSLLHQLRITKDQILRTAIIDAMAINETYFFRAPQVFDTLRSKILPALFVARCNSRCLRIWCAGCSTGQEMYSIAMMLNDHFPELCGWSIQLVGTDISDQSLNRARQGRYNQFEVQRGLPVQFLIKYFKKESGTWQISDDLRRRVLFQKHNLLDSFADLRGTFDIILVRNVLIYFDTAKKSTVFAKVRQLIAADGYLLLGESETVFGLTEQFKPCKNLEGFYAPS